ncbi:MAG: hypothetical protein ACLVBP_09945 [Ruminococcus sp.]
MFVVAWYKRSFEETKAWYDGYELITVEENQKKIYSMYSPKSVVDAMLSGVFDNYWNQTETYEANSCKLILDWNLWMKHKRFLPYKMLGGG